MDFFFDCPSCNGSLVADDTCVGESTACPHCSKWILIPSAEISHHDSIHRDEAPIPPQHAREEGIPVHRLIDPILVRELEEVRARYRKLKEDYELIESKVKEAKNSNAEALKKQVAALTQERDALAVDLSMTKTTFETYQFEAEKENQSRILELENSKRQLVEMRTQRLDAMQALEFSKVRTIELETECKKLQTSVTSGRSDLEGCRVKLHKSRNEQQVLMDASERKERELKAANEALKLELAQALEIEKQRALELEGEYKTLQSSMANGHSELEECRLKLHKARNEQQGLKDAWERKERELKAANESLKLELAQALEIEKQRALELEGECKTLQSSMASVHSELEECRLKLHKSRNELQVSDRKERELKAANETLKLELEQVRQDFQTQQDAGVKAMLTSVETHLMDALAEIKLRIKN